MKHKIVFRADAGQNIGYGHFIRSLALADMLKDDFDVSLASVNPTDYQKNELSNVCPLVSLNSETHFEDFLSMLQGNEIVVLDNYFFTTDYQREIKAKGCKLVCIDDMHDKHYLADMLINHGIDNPALFSAEPYTRLCLGLEWALLRRPFIEASLKNRNKKPRNVIENVAVSFGGVDPYHLTDRIINMFLSEPNILQIDAIVGKEYHPQIENNTGKSIVFRRAISAQEVADLFSNCDLAVLSASTVCIEALACGASVAAGYYVDNQKEFYEYLKANRFVYGLDSLTELQILDIHNISSWKTNAQPSVCCNTNLYIEYFKTLNN
jgi:UDP-2,4-diacetamido-2,4,6-trideoxy-beta-L-altropyranose hydrolase